MALNFSDKGITNSVSRLTFNGPNLQPIKDWSERTINGVTCSVSDGVGYLNGTSTAGSWQRIETGSITLSAGTYTIYFFTNFIQLDDGKNRLAYIGIGLRNSAHEDLFHFNGAGYKTFTLSGTETFDIVFWWNTSGMIFSNTYVKSMVRQGGYNPSYKFNPYGPNNIVKKLIKDGLTVWCEPHLYTLVNTGRPSYIFRITSTEEPTGTTGSPPSGSTVFFRDGVEATWYEGETSESTSSVVPSSVATPVLTNLYTGSYGAYVENTNSFAVDAYYRLSNEGDEYTKKGTIAANTKATWVGLTHTEHVALYVYFRVAATKTTVTTTNTYYGNINGTNGGRHKGPVTPDGLQRWNYTGTVADDVVFTATKSTVSHTTTSSENVDSSVASLSMHR